jgi:hypothetical protein
MVWRSKSIEKVINLMKKEEKGRELDLYFGLKARWLDVRRWKMKKVNGGAGKCRIYIVGNQILSMTWQGRSGAAYFSGDSAGADRWAPPPPPEVSCYMTPLVGSADQTFAALEGTSGAAYPSGDRASADRLSPSPHESC